MSIDSKNMQEEGKKRRSFKGGKFVFDLHYLKFYARRCGWKATLVYLALCSHADKDQYCFPGIRLLSDELGISENSVKRGIQKLGTWNIIVVNQAKKRDGTWKNNSYVLLDKSEWKQIPYLCDESTGSMTVALP